MIKQFFSAFVFLFFACLSLAASEAFTVTVACAEGWGDVYVSQPGTVSATVVDGEGVEIHAVAAEGCEFEYWKADINGTEERVSEPEFTYKMAGSDVIFTAVFSKVVESVVFEDDFEQNGNIPDPRKWMLCRKGKAPWSVHLSESYDQAYVKDGNLVLVAEKVDGIYKAGGIRMPGSLGFRYGHVEVSARFTSMAQGAWPAIWMLPSAPIWEGWPQGGEIDIMEHLNRDDRVWNVIHSNYIDNLGHTTDPENSANPEVDVAQYNTYAIDWDQDAITFHINGKKTLTYPNMHLDDNDVVKQWPFDAPFYLILNNALGGPGTWPGNITDSQLPSVFEVDYVKVTQRIRITSE